MDMNQAREGKVTATDINNALTNVQTLLTRYEWVESIGRPNAYWEGNETMTKAVVFGNLEEDLAAIAEELPEFTTDVQIETVVVKD